MASKHMVTCVECGRRFDANYGSYYDKKSRRYICVSCGSAKEEAQRKEIAERKAAERKEAAEKKATERKENAERKATEREAETGMRQSYGAMIVKIVLGVLFVFAGFASPESGWTIGYFLTALALGAGMIAWGLLPYINAQKAKKMKAADKEIVAEAAKNEVKECASCGAIGSGTTCEYCGRKYSE